MLAIRLCLLHEHWQIDMLIHTYNHPMLNEQCQFQTALYGQGDLVNFALKQVLDLPCIHDDKWAAHYGLHDSSVCTT
jgi:hypothetical protein